MSNTYKAMVVAPDGRLVATRKPLVEPEVGTVRIKVEACGICHSDAATVHPHPDTQPGIVPGHEIVGLVDALGDDMSGFSLGQRVGLGFLGGHCGGCDACRRGDFTVCTNQNYTGMTVDGGYAEYVYARASGVVRIPDQFSPSEAAPLLCAGLTTYKALEKSGARSGSRVAVQGIGGLGHLRLQYADKLGYEVIAIARGKQKQNLAHDLGADWYIDSEERDPGAQLAERGGVDAIIATAASGRSMSPLITGLRHGGTIVAVGVSDEPIEVAPMSLIFGAVTLTGSLTGSAVENEDNLHFAAAQGIRAMTKVVELDSAQHAFDRMMAGDARFRMVLSM